MFRRATLWPSAVPDGGRPLYFWNAMRACWNTQSFWPSTSPAQNPRSFRRCWMALTSSAVEPFPRGLSGAASAGAASRSGPLWAVAAASGAGGGVGAAVVGGVVVAGAVVTSGAVAGSVATGCAGSATAASGWMFCLSAPEIGPETVPPAAVQAARSTTRPAVAAAIVVCRLVRVINPPSSPRTVWTLPGVVGPWGYGWSRKLQPQGEAVLHAPVDGLRAVRMGHERRPGQQLTHAEGRVVEPLAGEFQRTTGVAVVQPDAGRDLGHVVMEPEASTAATSTAGDVPDDEGVPQALVLDEGPLPAEHRDDPSGEIVLDVGEEAGADGRQRDLRTWDGVVGVGGERAGRLGGLDDDRAELRCPERHGEQLGGDLGYAAVVVGGTVVAQERPERRGSANGQLDLQLGEAGRLAGDRQHLQPRGDIDETAGDGGDDGAGVVEVGEAGVGDEIVSAGS